MNNIINWRLSTMLAMLIIWFGGVMGQTFELPWTSGTSHYVSRTGTPPPTGSNGSTCYSNYGFNPHGYVAIDFDTPNGVYDAVRAVASGTVIFSGISGSLTTGYGLLVKIQHSDNTITYYAHNNELFVSVGDFVNQGCIIADGGTTGNSSGDHIHFEWRDVGDVAFSNNQYPVFTECSCIPKANYCYISANSNGTCGSPCPAPNNDNCSAAITLTSNGSCVTGTVLCATGSYGANQCSGCNCTSPDDKDVYFKFTAVSTSHTVTLSDYSTNFDGVVELRSACALGTSLGCFDPTGAPSTISYTWNGLSVGQQYYVRVFEYNNTGTPPTSPTFTICVTHSGCTNPGAVTVSGGGTFCNNATLTASGGSGGTIYWQGTTSNGTSTSTPSTSQSVTSSGTYYFRAHSGGCWGTQGSATVTINQVPGNVTVSGGGTFCSSTIITASGGSGGTIYWQGTNSNGTSTATPSTSQSVSSSGTYYFRAFNGTCWGTPGSVTVTIGSTPGAVTVSGGGTFCNNATLTASGGSGGTIYWQGTTSNGTSTSMPSTSQSVTSSGTYYFRAHSGGCWGTQGSATVTINVTPPLESTDFIDPITEACEATSVTFSVNPVANATVYNWQLPIGWSGNSTSNQITVTVGDTSGLIQVQASDGCNISPQASLSFSVNNIPGILSPISGPTEICQGLSYQYGIPVVPGMPEIVWEFPISWTGINLTAGTLEIIPNNQSGTISVYGVNECGQGPPQSVNITVFGDSESLTITGPSQPCVNSLVTYIVSGLSPEVVPSWTVPFGWLSNQDGNSVNILVGSSVGPAILSVSGVQECGTATGSLPVSLIEQPGGVSFITGELFPELGATEIYLTGGIPDGSIVNWGASGASPSIQQSVTNQMSVTWISEGVQTVSAFYSNSCGFGGSHTIQVSVIPTGIEEQSNESGIKVYPNPVSDQLFIDFGDTAIQGIIGLEMRNILGEMVLNRNLFLPNQGTLETIEINNLASGTYLLKLISQGKTDVFKVLKH